MVVHWLSNKYMFINIELFFLYMNDSLIHVFGCNIKGMNSTQNNLYSCAQVFQYNIDCSFNVNISETGLGYSTQVNLSLFNIYAINYSFSKDEVSKL